MRHRTDPTKVAMLRELGGLDRVPSTELAALGTRLDVVDVPAGRCLLEQGRGGRYLMLVHSGRASVHRDGTRVAEVGPGGVLGEVATRTGGPHTATVVTETPMRLLVANPPATVDVLERLEELAPSIVPANAAAATTATTATTATRGRRSAGAPAGASPRGDRRPKLVVAHAG